MEHHEAHLKHLNLVLDRIAKANLKVKPSKCKCAQNSVKYLGHIVGNGSRSRRKRKSKAYKT